MTGEGNPNIRTITARVIRFKDEELRAYEEYNLNIRKLNLYDSLGRKSPSPVGGFYEKKVRGRYESEGYTSYFPPNIEKIIYDLFDKELADRIISIKKVFACRAIHLDILAHKSKDDYFFVEIKSYHDHVGLIQLAILDKMISSGIKCELVFCLSESQPSQYHYKDNRIIYSFREIQELLKSNRDTGRIQFQG
jgi:hypothetical protein